MTEIKKATQNWTERYASTLLRIQTQNPKPRTHACVHGGLDVVASHVVQPCDWQLTLEGRLWPVEIVEAASGAERRGSLTWQGSLDQPLGLAVGYGRGPGGLGARHDLRIQVARLRLVLEVLPPRGSQR